MVTYAFNLNTQGAEKGMKYEYESTMVYIVSSRPSRVYTESLSTNKYWYSPKFHSNSWPRKISMHWGCMHVCKFISSDIRNVYIFSLLILFLNIYRPIPIKYVCHYNYISSWHCGQKYQKENNSKEKQPHCFSPIILELGLEVTNQA